MACLTPVLLCPGTPDAPFFDGQNSDWTSVRLVLRRKYKNDDLDQLMNSREFLEALKKKSRTEEDDILNYCRLFASISRGLVLRKRLDLYTQCQWFLQGLPETLLMRTFYRYDIDLEDDNRLDFEDLLEKVLVLVKCRNRLAAFLQDQAKNSVDEYIKPHEAVTPTIVQPLTYTAQDLTPTLQFRTVQGAIQEGVPAARINRLKVDKGGIIEPVVDKGDCVLGSNLAEDFYGDLGALFTNSEPVDEGLDQLHVNSVGIVAPFEYATIPKTGTHGPNTRKEGTVRTFFDFFDAETRAMN